MFSAIRRYLRHVTDAELADPAKALTKGSIVAFPVGGRYLLATNADIREAHDELVQQTKDEPLVLLPSEEHFLRVFPTLDRIAERIRALEDRDRFVLRLPHEQFPSGLSVQFSGDEAISRLIIAAKCPVLAVEARDRAGQLLIRSADVARTYRSFPEHILDFGALSGADRGIEIAVLRAGFAVKGANNELLESLSPALTKRVLFVCIGNVNRSAFARARLDVIANEERSFVASHGWDYVPAYHSTSAGVSASEDYVVPDFMLAAARRYGCAEAMAQHKPKIFNDDLAQNADLIFPLADDVTRAVESRMIGKRTRVIRTRVDVTDPMGGAPDAYVAMAAHVEQLIAKHLLSSGCGLFKEEQ
ncbi:MAG: hypothetical protein L6Q71_03275 [Planctomycetes bacterium]|nr:hypothetical protein [Planctomycetota bacterium]